MGDRTGAADRDAACVKADRGTGGDAACQRGAASTGTHNAACGVVGERANVGVANNDAGDGARVGGGVGDDNGHAAGATSRDGRRGEGFDDRRWGVDVEGVGRRRCRRGVGAGDGAGAVELGTCSGAGNDDGVGTGGGRWDGAAGEGEAWCGGGKRAKTACRCSGSG